MASQAYYDWVAAGKPYTRSMPTWQARDVIRAHGYIVYDYPNPDHQTAEPPEDHTAYSATGWPIPSRRWVGHAIDIMPDGLIPVGLPRLARQVIADKDANVPGTEWIKYINWTDENGDCWQTSWKPYKKTVRSTDKWHIHVSGRSDMDASTVVADSGWDPVARALGEDDMFSDDDRTKLSNVYAAVFTGGPSCGRVVGAVTTNPVRFGNSLIQKLDYLCDQLDAANKKLSDLAAGGVPPADIAAVKATVDQIKSDTGNLVDSVKAAGAAVL